MNLLNFEGSDALDIKKSNYQQELAKLQKQYGVDQQNPNGINPNMRLIKSDSNLDRIPGGLNSKETKLCEKLIAFKKIMPYIQKYTSITDGVVPIESLASLVPGLGDAGMGIINGVVMGGAGLKLNAGMWFQFKNLIRQGVDTALGVPPLIGDVFDMFFKSNKAAYEDLLDIYAKTIKKANKTKIPKDWIKDFENDHKKLTSEQPGVIKSSLSKILGNKVGNTIGSSNLTQAA